MATDPLDNAKFVDFTTLSDDEKKKLLESGCVGAENYGLSAGLRPCPHCGYCPACGRPQNVPYCPPFPYNPWYSGTWCSGGTGGVNTSV